jgi:predicted nicotinamide N-methyase
MAAAGDCDHGTRIDKLNHRVFILQHTTLLPVPLVPEISLYLAHEAVPLWQKTEDELGEMGLPPPFWAFAWAGGQALARYVLDHPETVRGKRVIDLAAGSGLVGIAAMKSGASQVLAADIDEFANVAISLNAQHNQVEVSATRDDLLETMVKRVDVILVGDLFYEKSIASRCYDWLLKAKQEGVHVMIGDPGRSYLPKDKLTKIAEYSVPVTRDLEDAEIKRTAVWTLI